MEHRTFFYWPTRIVLVVAIGAVLLTVLLFIAALQGVLDRSWDPPFAALAILIPAAGVVGALIGLAWMIRIFRGPREEEPPPWRNRDRSPAYGPTRILLVVGIAAVLFAGVSIAFEPTFMGGGDRPRLWENPLVVAGFLGMLVGLARMIRIFRGPRDEPPPWRYRDR